MEENGMLEREIVEYCAPLEEIGIGETYSCNNYDEKTTKSRLSNWILSLAKKVVITSVVMSSVPVLLPPLVVISALGCALSLPYGVVFASYACTDRLMRKLLQEEEEEEGGEELVVSALDEEEQREALKDAIEMRIDQLVDNEDSNLKSSAAGRDDEVIKVGGHMSLLEEKKSTHDDDDDDPENEKPCFSLMIDELRNPEDKDLININVGGSREDVTSYVQIDKLEKYDHTEEEQDPYLSQDKNEKVTVASVNNDKKGSEGKSSCKEVERRGKRKTSKFPKKRKEILEGHEKLSGEEKGIILKETETSAAQEKLGQSPEIVVQETSEDRTGSISSDKERCIMLIGSENNDTKRVAPGSNHNILLNDDVGNTDASLEKEEKPAAGIKDMLETRSVNDGSGHDVCSKMNIDESNTSTGVRASEIVAANEEKIEHRAVTVNSDPGENYNQSKTIAGDDELKHDEAIPEVKEEKIACAVDGGGHSDEGLLGEEKIWETMEAIRVIVGYKAPRSASYVEELKALYLFIGIEPSSDSAEFHNKLCFLMSVIGLK